MGTNGHGSPTAPNPVATPPLNKPAAAAQATSVFLQQVVDGISSLPDIVNTTAQSTARISGKSKDAQGQPIEFPVDLQWVFKREGKDYKAIVHLRDWARPVMLPTILALKSVLNELPKQYTAVVVTMRGAEKTALEYARAHGIKICLLKPLTQERLKTSESSVFVRFKGLMPQLSSMQLKIDPQWRAQNQVDANDLATIASASPDTLKLYSETGKPLGSIADLFGALVPRTEMKAGQQKIESTFKEAVYIHTDNAQYNRIKLAGVSAVVSLEEFESGLGQLEIAQQILDCIIKK
jgi:hypothetical protein